MTQRKPIVFFFIFFLIASNISLAQDNLGLLFWSVNRDLAWEDFRGNRMIDEEEPFFLDLHIEGVTEEAIYYPMNVYEAKVYAFLNTSYVDEEVKSDTLLRFLNAYYDLAAVYAQEYSKRILLAQNSEDEIIRSKLHLVVEALREEWKVESIRFMSEVDGGNNFELLMRWEENIRSRLLNPVEPVYSKSNFPFGFSFSVGHFFSKGDYDKYVSGNFGVVFGLEVQQRPWSFHFDVGINEVNLEREIAKGKELFPLGSKPDMTRLGVGAGFNLIDTRNFRLTPRLGLLFSSLAYSDEDDFDAEMWAVSYTPGLTADIKLKPWDLTQIKRSMFYSEVSLRLSAYYYPIEFGYFDLSNYVISAGVSIEIGYIRASAAPK